MANEIGWFKKIAAVAVAALVVIGAAFLAHQKFTEAKQKETDPKRQKFESCINEADSNYLQRRLNACGDSEQSEAAPAAMYAPGSEYPPKAVDFPAYAKSCNVDPKTDAALDSAKNAAYQSCALLYKP